MFRTRRRYTLRLPDGRSLALGPRTLVMGVLNVTPDSFADGGRYHDPARAADAAVRLEAEGADIIDIGGESTRPGAEAVGVEEELARVIPVVEQVVRRLRVPVSVDTYKAVVARHAVDHGAAIVNDVSALGYDPGLADVVATSGVPVVLMHTRGRSRRMYDAASYRSVSSDVARELDTAVERAVAAGVELEQIVLDPGLGFAKRAGQTFEMLASLDVLDGLDRPVLVGPSRKSFLDQALGERSPETREWGTAAAVTAAVLAGAHIVRVHGVREMVDVVRVADELVSGDHGPS